MREGGEVNGVDNNEQRTMTAEEGIEDEEADRQFRFIHGRGKEEAEGQEQGLTKDEEVRTPKARITPRRQAERKLKSMSSRTRQFDHGALIS